METILLSKELLLQRLRRFCFVINSISYKVEDIFGLRISAYEVRIFSYLERHLRMVKRCYSMKIKKVFIVNRDKISTSNKETGVTINLNETFKLKCASRGNLSFNLLLFYLIY